MANNTLRGDAQDINQIQSFTLTTVALNAVYKVTINGKDISYTATGTDTNATAAAALQALLAASSVPEFREVSWTNTSGSNIIYGESVTPGVPFTATVSGTAGATFNTAITQTATGKNWIDNAENWSLGRVPAGELSAPVQATASATTGGSLIDTLTYYWVITATNPLGETVKSNEKSLVIAAPNQTHV